MANFRTETVNMLTAYRKFFAVVKNPAGQNLCDTLIDEASVAFKHLGKVIPVEQTGEDTFDSARKRAFGGYLLTYITAIRALGSSEGEISACDALTVAFEEWMKLPT